MGLKNLLCTIFGHSWIYGDFKGIQSQPTQRACKRCEEVQRFYGELTACPGAFGQFWYGKRHWKNHEQFLKWEEGKKLEADKFNELTKGGK